MADWPTAVPRQRRVSHALHGGHRRAAAAAHAQSPHRSRPGDHLFEVPEQGPRTPLRLGRAAGGRPGTLAGRRADCGEAVGSGERLLKWVKRRPMVAALLATVVLVTLAGVGGITWALAVALNELRRAEW